MRTIIIAALLLLTSVAVAQVTDNRPDTVVFVVKHYNSDSTAYSPGYEYFTSDGQYAKLLYFENGRWRVEITDPFSKRSEVRFTDDCWIDLHSHKVILWHRQMYREIKIKKK